MQRIVRVFISLFFSSNLVLFCQIPIGPLPLQKGNQWIYEDDLGRDFYFLKVLDSNYYVDSIRYWGVERDYLGITGVLDTLLMRFREDSAYVIRRPDFYQEPNHEQIYFIEGLEVGEGWQQIDYPSHTTTQICTARIVSKLIGSIWGITGSISTIESISDEGLLTIILPVSEVFGVLSSFDLIYGSGRFLKGCIINGIAYGDTSGIPTSVDDVDLKADMEYQLYQNYPNPFNNSTMIRFHLLRSQYVRLELFNDLGQLVEIIKDDHMVIGEHTFNYFPVNLSSGVYFLRLMNDRNSQSIKMILLK